MKSPDGDTSATPFINHNNGDTENKPETEIREYLFLLWGTIKNTIKVVSKFTYILKYEGR